MKFRTAKYFIKEGFSNIWANKWMNLASSIVVFTTLYIFGIFFLFTINIDNITGKVEDQPMNAFAVDSITDKKSAETVKGKIEKIDGVKIVKLVSKEEGLNEIKQGLDDHEELLAGIKPDFLSYKFVVNISNPQDAERIKTTIESLKEIKKVKYPKEAMEKLLGITNICRILSYAVIGVLGTITLFIIIYTIKLTVFARRREINIMKYVGATDWFIKWPFVVEGVIIGLIGAFLATMLILSSYSYLFNVVGSINIMSIQLISLNPLVERKIFFIFTLLGSVIGAVGSIISVRKYLDV